MHARVLVCSLLFLALTACTVSISSNEPTAGPPFLTSTLPVTHTPFPTPVTPSATAVPPTVNPTLAACKERAVVVQDVTIPDNTYMAPGAAFTKTWRFKNTGNCAWEGFIIAFASGDRMGAPDSVPVPTTAPNATADVSVQLTAPTSYNAYAGYFVLNDQYGKPVAVGIYKNFWVKIIVGNVPTGTPAAGTPLSSASNITQTPKSTGCKYSYSLNAGYIGQLENLINSARTGANLPALAIDATLSAAAQGHSVDMACNNYLSHTGSDGSMIADRLTRAGYNTGNGFTEIIAIGTPNDAMRQWKDDAGHWDTVVASGPTIMGIGYAYNAKSDFGGYFTVDFGSR